MTEKHSYEVPGNSPWHAAQNVAQGAEILAYEYEHLRGDKRYRVTVELIEPPKEQPQWWRWDDAFGWSKTGPAIVREGVQRNSAHHGYNCVIYGTTADRDAKRDALLDAAKAAGKGE